jgi:hypothetical protein
MLKEERGGKSGDDVLGNSGLQSGYMLGKTGVYTTVSKKVESTTRMASPVGLSFRAPYSCVILHLFGDANHHAF